jgi:hypothetical protein
MQQPNATRQDLLALQTALSVGNLASAQQALSHFEQDLQSTRPQQNGIRTSDQVNPASALRTDLQALQSALDSGDLAMAEEAFLRVQQNNQSIQGGQAKVSGQNESGIPKETSSEQDAVGPAQVQPKINGNLIDVVA